MDADHRIKPTCKSVRKDNASVDIWLNKSLNQNDIKEKQQKKTQTFVSSGFEKPNKIIQGMIVSKRDDTGEIQKVPCIRVPQDIDHEDVYEELLKWTPDAKPPKAVLSLTGESTHFLNNETLVSRLKSGLLNLITTTSLWIFTGGTNYGITTSVGEAVREYKEKHDKNDHIMAFGFLPWAKKLKNIEQNHTHFVMVDGSKDKASELRTKLRFYFFEERQIPVILLIVEGGCKTFERVLLSVKRGMPVLIIEGSGKAADFISKGYRLSENKTSDESSIFTETFTSEMLPLAIRITTDSNVDPIKLVEQLKECLQKRKMINVFSLDDTNETLDRMIQNMIFMIRNKDDKMDTEKKIQLVNRWNRPDIAEKEIFNMEKRQDIEKIRDSLKDKDSAISDLFRKSLVDNRKDFVTLVLKYILETKCYQQFVTENLSLLYSECMDPGGSCRAGQLLQEYIQSSKLRIRKTGDNKIDTSDSKNLDIINKAVMLLLGNNKLQAITKEEHRPFTSKDPFKELFIWAVLMNRKEMAKLFWKKDRDFICAALYASSLAKKLEKAASSEGYMELTKYFAEDSRYYEKLAYDVMTELYIKDKHQARQLLVQKVQRYGSTTLFELSQHNHLMKFVEHTACQTKLNIIWKGNILPYTSHAKVIVAAFVPFMIQSIMIQDEKDKKGEYTPQIANSRYTSHEQRDFPNVKSIWSSKPGIESTKMQNQSGLAEQWNEIEFHQRIKNIYYFYNSPVTKFIFSLLAYIAFLVVFSLFVLTDLHPVSEGGISYKEYIIFGWATSMMTEELRQAFVLNTALLKYITWFKFWTIFEVFMYSLFYTSVLLRLTLSGDDFFYARAMYAITLGTFILNSMQFFIVSTAIGPKVIMIGRLIFDIIFFVLIFAVFVFGFGIIYHAIMYPNSEPGYLLFKEIIYIPYWQLYGELFLDTFQGTETDCTKDPELYKNGTMTRCPEVSEINYMLLAVYTVLTHIILVNFLIAMFSHTFTRSQDNNELVWKFHRFSLVQEYYDRCLLIPPLIILSHMKRAFFFILDKCCHVSNTKQVNVFRIDMKLKEKKRIDLLEKDAVNSYSNASVSLRKYRARAISSDEGSYFHDAEHSLHDQVEKVTKEVGKLQNFLEEMKQDIKDIKSYKQRVLLVELPKGIPSGTHVPEEVPMFQQTS